MAFNDFLTDRCDIYHLRSENKPPDDDPELPDTKVESYPEEPDEPNVPCSFNVKGGRCDIIQGEPQNNYIADIKLNLPPNVEVRENDKIVDLDGNYEYTARKPQKIRGQGGRVHHQIVHVYRREAQKAL